MKEKETAMKKITAFHLENCPYCIQAKKVLKDLAAEDARYASPDIEWIEESKEPEKTAGYDYYYVPTFFLGKEKLYEAHPKESYEECYASVKKSLDRALEE